MSAANLLKEEINQTLSELHDFSKWKLIAVSALAGVGLGFSDASIDAAYWLLLFAPFACAYVDLHSYQYLLRIFALSKALREYSDDSVLKKYENFCESLRDRGYFGMGMYAQLGSSLAFSLLLPGFAFVEFFRQFGLWTLATLSAALIWIAGVACVVACSVLFKTKSELIGGVPIQHDK